MKTQTSYLDIICETFQNYLTKEWFRITLKGKKTDEYVKDIIRFHSPDDHLLLFQAYIKKPIPAMDYYEIVGHSNKKITWRKAGKKDQEENNEEHLYLGLYLDVETNELQMFFVDSRARQIIVPMMPSLISTVFSLDKKAKINDEVISKTRSRVSFADVFSFLVAEEQKEDKVEEEKQIKKITKKETSVSSVKHSINLDDYEDEEDIDMERIRIKNQKIKNCKTKKPIVSPSSSEEEEEEKEEKTPPPSPKKTKGKKTTKTKTETSRSSKKNNKKVESTDEEEKTTKKKKKKKKAAVIVKSINITLPIRVQCTFNHQVYGQVRVIATLFYIDKMPSENYEYRHIVDDELFSPVSKDLMTAGRRVCMFHMIEDVQPAISAMQFLVGCMFSSFQISSNFLGNPQSAWDTWFAVLPSTSLCSLNDIFHSSEPTPPYSLVNNKKLTETFINYKSRGTSPDERKWLWKAGDFPIRDLMASLCINECDEYTCHPNMFILETSETTHWNGDANKWCKHNRVNGFDETKNGGGLTIFQDEETTAKFNIESDRNNTLKKPGKKKTKKDEQEDDEDEDEGETKKKPKRRTKKQVRKLDREFYDQIIRDNENTMKSAWGQRITFEMMDATCRIELFHHPFYFDEFYAILTTIRDEAGLEMLIPYQFTHFLDTRFVTTQQDYDNLNKYFTCFYESSDADEYFLCASKVGPNYTPSRGDTHLLMKWQLKQRYYRTWEMNQMFFSRMSDDEMHTIDRRYYLYVPIPYNLIEDNHLVKTCETSQELCDVLQRWALAVENPESHEMRMYNLKNKQLAEIMALLEDETTAETVDHRLKFTLEAELKKFRQLLFCDQTLFNEMNMEFHRQEELMIFVTKMRARFTGRSE